MRRILQLLCLTAVLAFASRDVLAQERTVSGRVTSAEDGSGLPGVNVVVKGSSVGTSTDVNGGYAVSVTSDQSVLVFTFIGLQSQEVTVGTRTTVDVQMAADVTQLSEVVVTGYQSQLKREITGSVVSVSGETFKNLPVQSFDRALQGRVAGTQISAASGQPGGALNIRIRGISSINAGNQPLIVIDGVQVSSLGTTTQGSANPLNSINPNDIEDIQILKDAASSAIYGAQAANGVIVVTTKSGNKSGKTQIDINMQEGIVQPQNLYKMMNGRQYAEIHAEAEVNSGLDPARVGGAYQLFGNPTDGSTIEDYDWVKNMFKDARFKMYDVSMRGGDKKTSFLFSGSYNKQEGQVIMSEWERLTGRLNLTHQATEKLSVSAKISVAYNRTFGAIENGNFVNGPWVAAFSSMPVSPAVNPETGDFNAYPLNNLAHLARYNILQGVNEEVRVGKTFQTVSSFSASYQIVPGLTATGFVGIDYSMNRDDNQRPSTIPAFAGTNGSVLVNNRRTANVNSNVNLSYVKKFNDIHTLKFLLGYEYKFEEREGASLTAIQFANPYFRLPSQGQPQAVTGFWNEYKRLGYFGKIDYDFKDKYLASFTLRRDGHSRFGDVNPYGTFYAASIGWRISSESFLENTTWIDDLKFKAGYGILGNAEIGDFATITKFGSVAGQYLGSSLLSVTQLGNDQISWEEEESINIGLDYSLLNNRLFGSIEVWQTNNNDLLFNVPYLQSSGVRTPTITQNVGSMRNQGIDLEVGGIIMDRGDFRWTSKFNIGLLKNEVTSLYNGLDTLFTGAIPTLIVGQPSDFNYLLRYAGVNPANGAAMVYDRNGNLTYNPVIADATITGSAIPSSYGGFSNTFSFKGISLDVFFQYQFGNEAFNQDLYNLDASGSGYDNQRTTQLDRWQQPGDVTNVPMATVNGVIGGVSQNFGFVGSDRYQSDGSYIRLKSVTLSYDLPNNILSKVGLRSVRVYGQAFNLLTWTKYDGIDPEVVGNNNANGVSSYGTYPLGRQMSVGLNIGL
jgi:TonB-linked SusC/RagA family outer membrane protein